MVVKAMELVVLKRTEAGNLLLEDQGQASNQTKPVKARTPLYKRGKRVAVLRETIGLVEKPLYLAEPKDAEAKKGVKQGDALSTKKRS